MTKFGSIKKKFKVVALELKKKNEIKDLESETSTSSIASKKKSKRTIDNNGIYISTHQNFVYNRISYYYFKGARVEFS